jgi:UDP-N-acetyl-D-glucosamine dehydrogenase
LYLQEINQIVKRVNDKNIALCVVGVGTIGLPLATFLADKGFSVRGLDVSEKRVEQINSGTVVYEYQDMLKKVRSEEKLEATTDPEKALKDVEVIFICVPTPLNKKREMDISNLYDVSKKIAPYLKKGMMIIFESSVAIGTTKQVSKKIEEMTELRFGKELGLAYCPERYNPTPMKKDKQDPEFNTQSRGESFSVDKISRVVGGIDQKSTKIAKLFYSEFITTEILELSSIESAEATKLLENIFRDVNIALVNELAKIYPKFGLDVFEIINAAKSKPFAYMPHYPGAGVGGECIPVDTWYLISQAEKLGVDLKLMKTARMVNDSMPEHMIELLEKELKKINKKIDSAKITVLGLCYKKNIPDIRLSPTFPLLEKLTTKNAETIICDPVYEGIKSPINLTPITEAFKNSDVIILMTDHDDFKKIDFVKIKNQMNSHIVIDGRNLFKDKKLEELGFVYKVVGKP